MPPRPQGVPRLVRFSALRERWWGRGALSWPRVRHCAGRGVSEGEGCRLRTRSLQSDSRSWAVLATSTPPNSRRISRALPHGINVCCSRYICPAAGCGILLFPPAPFFEGSRIVATGTPVRFSVPTGPPGRPLYWPMVGAAWSRRTARSPTSLSWPIRESSRYTGWRSNQPVRQSSVRSSNLGQPTP